MNNNTHRSRSGGFRGRSNFSSSSRRESFGARSSGPRAPRPFDPKRSFKKDNIDIKLFVNKAIVVKDEEVYVPQHSYADFGLSEKLLNNILAMGIKSPSPIQDQAIPVVMTGKDVIGIASTGTGKTAAFLVPMIKNLQKDYKDKVMVLCPTRELAEQVEGHFRRLTKDIKLYSYPIVGGSPIFKQIHELKNGLDLVVGTPGRVKDLIERGKIDMKDYKYIVLDEADRMLDMGFIGDMREILGKMRPEKQGMFFSATFSSDIKKLCKDFLNDPITITIKSRDTSANVNQDVIKFSGRDDKFLKLRELLGRAEASKVIIFRETKRDTDGLAEELKRTGYKARGIHGDMRNGERKRALQELTTGMINIVIATDVAARGIDISDITHVVNYDIPNNYETYVHRIGRTGRAGKTGEAYTFVPGR